MQRNKYFIIFYFISLPALHHEFPQLFNKGVELHKENPTKSIELFTHALQLEPSSIEAHYNLAFLLRLAGKWHESLPHYDFVLQQQPNHAAAHLGMAQIRLMNGDFELGWPELEWHIGELHEDTKMLKEYVINNYALKNKIILLRAEWGAGDTIQMIRFAKILHARGAYVVVHLLHDSLVPLFKQQPYLDQVVPPSHGPPPFHWQIPMMNLPSIFGITQKNIPLEPYIQIDKQLIEKWHDILKSDSNFKIGICWRGNYIHNPEKFMPLSFFAQLATIAHVSLYSLQKIHGLDQLELLENKHIIKTFDTQFDAIPFFDTAAIMKNLDLVITVDTSIAHLAGALGVPVWVVLPVNSDWRWMKERSDTPWYKTMRLFRQKRIGVWGQVYEEIASTLKKVLNFY